MARAAPSLASPRPRQDPEWRGSRGWAGLSCPAQTWPKGNECRDDPTNHHSAPARDWSGPWDVQDWAGQCQSPAGVPTEAVTAGSWLRRHNLWSSWHESIYRAARWSCQGPKLAPSPCPRHESSLLLPPGSRERNRGRHWAYYQGPSVQNEARVWRPSYYSRAPKPTLPHLGAPPPPLSPQPPPACLLVWVNKCIVWLREILRSLIIVPQ